MSSQSISQRLSSQWRKLAPLPGGKILFSRMLGIMVPYTGSIGARVMEIEPGYAKISLRDRRKIRNHLNCIHAIALMNLGEVTTGLAVLTGMPGDARGILAGLSMEYLKKARGRLISECRCEIPQSSERKEYQIEALIKDASGETVAVATARWLIGPVENS